MCPRQKRRISPFIRTEETGRRLRSLLASRGLTVKDVQKYLGLSCPQSIYRWLDGKSLPSIDNLYALQGLFHMPMDQLLCGSFSGFSRKAKEPGNHKTQLQLYSRLFAYTSVSGVPAVSAPAPDARCGKCRPL